MSGSHIIVGFLLAIAGVLAYLLHKSFDAPPPADAATPFASPTAATPHAQSHDQPSLSDLEWHAAWPALSSIDGARVYLRTKNANGHQSYVAVEGSQWRMTSSLAVASPVVVRQCPHSTDTMMFETDGSSGTTYLRCATDGWQQCFADGTDDLVLGCYHHHNSSDISEQTFRAANTKGGFHLYSVKSDAEKSGNCGKNCGPGEGHDTVNLNGNAGVPLYKWEYARMPQ